jgi:hypothetical protein
VLKPGYGSDVFVFDEGRDRIDLRTFGLDDYAADVAPALARSGGDTVLSLPGGETALIAGVLPGALDGSDFLV